MSIILEQLTKRYSGHPVVNNVSLEVADGEFFVLLGSSGSGKTTILSMIAGLTPVDHGRILLHGRDVTHLTPQERRVGFVFQHYALFQHMTVADNIEFGLRVRQVTAAERRRRRDELLELVGLTGLGNRLPGQISGGQQQRVALARALAYQPEVLLLDEPLGALDAKIRLELRRTLRAIQRELKVTSILVTHDQEEAFELADRIGVMSFGRLLEIDTPQTLYQQPQTEFVATFLGSANLLVGRGCSQGVQIGATHFPLNGSLNSVNGNGHLKLSPPNPPQGGEKIKIPPTGGLGRPEPATNSRPEPHPALTRMQLLFRPEDVMLAPSPEALACPQLGRGEVEETLFSGSFERLRLRLPPIPDVRPIAPPVSFGDGSILVEATRPQEQAYKLPLHPGDQVWVGVHRVHALAHPGLNFLILTDGSAQAQAALTLGGQIGRLAHARVTVLGHGQPADALQTHLRQARESLGSGLAALDTKIAAGPLHEAIAREAERQSYDLVILGFQRQENLNLTEQILQVGEHHLLLVSQPQSALTRALICVTGGEPGKEDVLFAGRLVRHVGAEATLLSVLPTGEDSTLARHRSERFLARGVQTLQLLGVPARTSIRSGPIHEQITDEFTGDGYDLLVLGAPLPGPDGRITLDGIVSQILNVINRPVLIIRSGGQ